MLTANQRYTLAELFELGDDDDDQIYDLLGGEVVARNAPDLNHGAVLSELTLLLGDAQRRGYGQFFSGPHAVALDYPQRGMAARDVSHPDLFFIRAGREALRVRPPRRTLPAASTGTPMSAMGCRTTGSPTRVHT